MKGIVIAEIPGKRKHKLQQFLSDFMDTGAKHFEVQYDAGEYKSVMIAYKCMHIAVQASKLPIQVSFRRGRVYLTRTDM